MRERSGHVFHVPRCLIEKTENTFLLFYLYRKCEMAKSSSAASNLVSDVRTKLVRGFSRNASRLVDQRNDRIEKLSPLKKLSK